jgi:hypothetical protein
MVGLAGLLFGVLVGFGLSANGPMVGLAGLLFGVLVGFGLVVGLPPFGATLSLRRLPLLRLHRRLLFGSNTNDFEGENRLPLLVWMSHATEGYVATGLVRLLLQAQADCALARMSDDDGGNGDVSPLSAHTPRAATAMADFALARRGCS